MDPGVTSASAEGKAAVTISPGETVGLPATCELSQREMDLLHLVKNMATEVGDVIDVLAEEADQCWSAEGRAAVTTLIRRIYSLPNASAVADRLEALQLTEAEGDEPLNAGSLLCFAEFLERESRVKAPTITLTPEGNIYASWRHGRSLLSIQFMPDGRISYVSFAADQLSSELSALQKGFM